MGCDIHTHIEYKRFINNEEKWVCADHFALNPYYDIDEDDKYYTVEVCGNRDYGLFATLANVRNYGNTEYIDEPRGLPEDTCEEIKASYSAWECDAHSCSYFTLKELIDFYNKNGKLKRSGLISKENAKKLDEQNIEPNEWCQMTNLDYVHREWEVENTSLKHLIDEIKRRADEDNFIYDFEWERGETPKRIEKIRFVFWFDN